MERHNEQANNYTQNNYCDGWAEKGHRKAHRKNSRRERSSSPEANVSRKHRATIAESSSESDSEDTSEDGSSRSRLLDYRLPGKLPKYDGSAKWHVYQTQFKMIIKPLKLDDAEKVQLLVQNLREKALEYYFSLSRSTKRSFKNTAKRMAERFGGIEPANVSRRLIFALKQEMEESLEAFGQRCQELARDGHPGEPEHSIQRTAIDAFLRGVTDQKAALATLERDPSTVIKAIRYMKHNIANVKFIQGEREKRVRTVSFAKPEEESQSSEIPLAVQELKELTKVLKESLLVQKASDSRTAPPQSRSSSSERRQRSSSTATCFRCQRTGHYKKDCPNPERCHLCGKDGHMHNTCPARTPSPVRSKNM